GWAGRRIGDSDRDRIREQAARRRNDRRQQECGQSKNRQDIFTAHINLAVDDDGHRVFEGSSWVIAGEVLIAVINFLREVGGVVGVENGSAAGDAVAAVVGIGLNNPGDAVVVSVRGD